MTRTFQTHDRIFIAAGAPSFATVLAHLRSDDALSATRKRDLISSIQRLGKLLGQGRPLSEVPADAEWCRIRLARVAPASLRISEKSWANLRSNLAAAFTAAGITNARHIVQLEGGWAVLWDKVLASGVKQLRTGLSRFPRFCQQNGLAPVDVDDAALVAYGAALRTSEINRDPDLAVYYAARAWNLAVEIIPGWPETRLAPPARRKDYALPWDSFPDGLEQEIDNWLAQRGSDDIFATNGSRRALKPSTVKLRKGSPMGRGKRNRSDAISVGFAKPGSSGG